MASANFADDEIAEAIDDPDLALKNERGGVELGDNGEALKACAGTETLTGIDRGFGRSTSRTTVRVPRRASSRAVAGRNSLSRGAGKTPWASTRKRDELDRGVLLGKGVEALVQPVEGGNRRRGRGLGHLAARPGDESSKPWCW